MQVRTYRNLVDGVWQEAAGGQTMEIFCPCDGELVSRVPASEQVDVDRAVAAARRAFEEENWAFNPRLRSQCLSAWGAAMRARRAWSTPCPAGAEQPVRPWPSIPRWT